MSFEIIYRYWNQVYTKHENCSVYLWNQNRNKIESECSSLRQSYLFICLFDYKALFVCVKDGTCIRMEITAYCFNIFGSVFGALFCLLMKKLILGCETIRKSMRCLSSLKCQYISSYGQKRNVSFSKTAHWYGLNFLCLFIRPENLNLKIFENLAAQTFLRENVSPFTECK